ncbi:MAG: hypothetical protein ABIG44_11850 [Planctomycetota bacterium]
MTLIRLRQNYYFTTRTILLKLLILTIMVPPANGQTSRNAPELRGELTRLLRTGNSSAAVKRAQQALRENPDNPEIRREYANLHVALAEYWLAASDFEASLTALSAALAVEPRHEAAKTLQVEIEAARQRAAQAIPEIGHLLQLELFESARRRLQEIMSLRPDLAEQLVAEQRAAWLGTADDHYLARNFQEAFALYEHLLQLEPEAPADVCSRWALSLALALAESDFSQPLERSTANRLLARAIDVLDHTNEPIIGLVIGGLLAERSGQLIDAGRTYAEALGVSWDLPPIDQRRARVVALRNKAIQRIRALYGGTPTQRRSGAWAIVLPDMWKKHSTSHFDVFARNDLVATRVAEALEYHYDRLAEWLDIAPATVWEPRLEVRVHACQEDLHVATGTTGITSAVSHTRLQGQRVLLRKLEVFQADPWLLSATLPHELTHALIADARRHAMPPLAIDEGLALHTEPAARRLMYRRLIGEPRPRPRQLLMATAVPAEQDLFYAQSDALTGWLLDRCEAHYKNATAVSSLLGLFQPDKTSQWWRDLGWETEAAMRRDWREWLAGRADPVRMPLMILAESTREAEPDAPRADPAEKP